MKILDLLNKAVEKKASDVIFSPGAPPMMRLQGKLIPCEEEKLTSGLVEKVLTTLLSEDQIARFNEQKQVNFAVSIKRAGRFRVNAYHKMGHTAAAFRAILPQIPHLETMGIPDSIFHLMEKNEGLIMITGPTGSGRTTTLASLVDYLNRTRACHIITLEQPVEFVHPFKKSVVDQREIGRDAPTYKDALKQMLAQNPDVVAVDDLPDLETIAAILKVAESGHLVISTLTTRSAAETIDRMIDVFPTYQQQQIRIQLTGCLKAVISQQLLPSADGEGFVAAREVMIMTPAVKTLLKEGKTFLIPDAISKSDTAGMITMDQSINSLLKNNKIVHEVAAVRVSKASQLEHAPDSEILKLEKLLYNNDINIRKKAELQLKELLQNGNREATRILEEFSRFFITNIEEDKIGLRKPKR